MEHRHKGFSGREMRALLWLLPVLTVVSWLVWEVARPHFGGNGHTEAPTEEVAANVPKGDAMPDITNPATSVTQQMPVHHEKFAFDPNTVEYHDLVRLGFTRGEALGIIKYRERGKVFEIPEDFAACYQVTEEMYRRLKPYIRIGEKYRLKPFARTGSQNSDPVARRAEPEYADASREQSAAITARRVSERALVDINTADSATLISVSGIGEATVMRIIEYRTRLGGFAGVEQLAEIRGVTEQNYERIAGQIFADELAIQKIDINFAPAKQLAAHPYIRAEALRKLLKTRQLKGGWSTAGELVEDNIFTPGEAAKLRPYLLFREFGQPNPIENQ